MNTIGQAHRALAQIAPDVAIDLLACDDVQATIHRLTKLTPPLRESPLHPALIVWLTLGMAIFRADSIPNVFSRLLARWRESRTWVSLRAVTDGALAHARKRLGANPLRWLFEDVASRVAPEPTFHGLRVWSIDGTVLSTPDTPANENAFGRHPASKGRSAFPQLRLLTLTAVRTHEIRDAHWVPYGQSELSAAPDVIRNLKKDDLLLLDRGFMSMWLYGCLADQGADFVARVRSTIHPKILAQRGTGDFDVEVRSARPKNDADKRPRVTLTLRLIEYHVGKGQQVRLLTSLTDPSIGAREIAMLYHERWEAELVFDELKTHMVGVRHGSLHLPFRGRSPALIEQEIWAMLAAFNLVRRLIATAARAHGIDPRRISFTDALHVIAVTWQAMSRAGDDLVRAYVCFVGDLADCVLDRWRRPRKWPRVVRIKSKTYARKAPWDCEEAHDASALLELGLARSA